MSATRLGGRTPGVRRTAGKKNGNNFCNPPHHPRLSLPPLVLPTMPMINLADVSLSKLRGYRDFVSPLSKYRLSWQASYLLLKAFQPTLADQSHQPFFSLDFHEDWTTLSGYELYETWLKNSKDLSQDTAHAQALIDSATAHDIKQFRDIVNFLIMNLKFSPP